MTTPGGIPVRGGPWDGSTFYGGSPNERVCVKLLRGGFYRVSEDKGGLFLEWVRA